MKFILIKFIPMLPFGPPNISENHQRFDVLRKTLLLMSLLDKYFDIRGSNEVANIEESI